MKKILVIDDEEWLREMIQLALQQRGFEVIEAANGADGIEMARKELPDLILCDVNMGKVDGYLTLSSLRNEAPTAAIPFILMTGLADNASMRHGMELGADDYLPKPFTTEGLYAAVEARLKKSQTVRDEAERKLAHLRDNISLMMPHEMRTPLNGIIVQRRTARALRRDAQAGRCRRNRPGNPQVQRAAGAAHRKFSDLRPARTDRRRSQKRQRPSHGPDRASQKAAQEPCRRAGGPGRPPAGFVI